MLRYALNICKTNDASGIIFLMPNPMSELGIRRLLFPIIIQTITLKSSRIVYGIWKRTFFHFFIQIYVIMREIIYEIDIFPSMEIQNADIHLKNHNIQFNRKMQPNSKQPILIIKQTIFNYLVGFFSFFSNCFEITNISTKFN